MRWTLVTLASLALVTSCGASSNVSSKIDTSSKTSSNLSSNVTAPVTPEPVTKDVPALVIEPDPSVVDDIAADLRAGLDAAGVQGVDLLSSKEVEAERAGALDTRADTDGVGEAQEVDPGDPIFEDDPRWDCRTMGNRACGVVIHDVWYVVTFGDDGQPVDVRTR